LRLCRGLISPLVRAELFLVFKTKLTRAITEEPGVPGLQIRLYRGPAALEHVERLLAASGIQRRLRPRLERGDAVAVATEDTRLAGFAWVAFSDMWAPELELTLLVPPKHIYHYDSLVLPRWRGRGIHGAMIHAAKDFARSQGCEHALSYINAANRQSLRLPQRWRSACAMRVACLRFRGTARKLRFGIGKPLHTMFRKAPARAAVSAVTTFDLHATAGAAPGRGLRSDRDP
jgi:GNAT superfamily N-acetyltransferase